MHAYKHTYAHISHTYPPAREYERPRCAVATLPNAFPFPLPSIVHLMHSRSRACRSTDRDVNDRELRQGKGARFDKWPAENNYRPTAQKCPRAQIDSGSIVQSASLEEILRKKIAQFIEEPSFHLAETFAKTANTWQKKSHIFSSRKTRGLLKMYLDIAQDGETDPLIATSQVPEQIGRTSNTRFAFHRRAVTQSNIARWGRFNTSAMPTDDGFLAPSIYTFGFRQNIVSAK